MATTLEWVRDHYDADKSRYIEQPELNYAVQDYFNGLITKEQLDVTNGAHDEHLLLPAYNDEHAVSFIIPTGATLKVDGS